MERMSEAMEGEWVKNEQVVILKQMSWWRSE
jgi:hypothetical protein